MSLPTPLELSRIYDEAYVTGPLGRAHWYAAVAVRDAVLDALAEKADNDPLGLLINVPTVDAINAGATVAAWLRSLKTVTP